MSIIVQKFGGTSVADSERILAAAQKAVRAHESGHQVVMVVSAMGKNTDMLVELARQINEKPPAREMDMLLSTGEQVSVALMAMAIDSLGHRAVSLTGGQIGIRTDSSHTKARIQSISTERIQHLLADNNIVIAAGFQGIDEDFNITTLGRGGSDTTAVALAAVLEADACEIYTDVDGIYTTDPRILEEARIVRQVSYDEMLELASLGAGVMHSRSIEFAKKFDVPIHVRSSLSDAPGSLIWNDTGRENGPVVGAAVTQHEARITLGDLPAIPGTHDQIFSSIAAQKITVDMIVQNLPNDGKVDISFTVPEGEVEETISVVGPWLNPLGGCIRNVDNQVSKISVVGNGMAREVGIAQKMFRSLADAGIQIQLITTGDIKISVLVKRDRARVALQRVHAAFGLDETGREMEAESKSSEIRRQRSVDELEVIERLREAGMEALVINDIQIDENQSSITIERVPNRAEVIASLFEQVAEGGVFVDMIIESHLDDEVADISFTVDRQQLATATGIADQFSEENSCGSVRTIAEIGKLTVSGIGLRSHTGVAVKMFHALAAAGINVVMINTSELKVNVVVNGAQSQKAIECLRVEFQATESTSV
jgi:aspartate kinase